MLKRPLALFLLCFAVVALSGVVVSVWGYASGDLNPNNLVAGLETGISMLAAFVIEAVILGIVSAWRGRVREWLAGYVGVVLGSAIFFVLAEYFRAAACAATGGHYTTGCLSGHCEEASCLTSPTATDLLSAVPGGVIYAANAAGVIFLAIGGLRLLNARAARRGLPTPPPVPPEAYGGGERG